MSLDALFSKTSAFAHAAHRHPWDNQAAFIIGGKAVVEQVKSGVPWRIIGWGGAVLLLAAPFVAMRVGAEGVNWSPGDFIVAGILFGLVGGAFELAVRAWGSWAYRGGAALALAGTLLTIWANLAVGIVGSEDNPGNQWFFAALLVGIVGACLARFRAGGLSRAALATAISLMVAFVIASLGPTDEPNVKHVVELAGTSVFAGLFLASAALFRKAARQ
jgi:hypothetical protein